MAGIFSGMTGFTFPNTVRNTGPLPPLSTGGMQVEFQNPDGMINQTNQLLDNVDAYAYGPNPQRPSTQVSYVNHPHRIQKVIPKIFLPAADEDGRGDIPLEHALHDGDLAFTLRMPKEMIVGPSEFCQARNIPGKVLAQVVNLATVNYLLWGLQIGRSRGNLRDNRWQDFFLRVTEGRLHKHKNIETQRAVWNFLQTYLRPFGVMVGSDMQGGQHEGGENRIATYPVDYVASFLIDGKCRKLNNHWRHLNIASGNDLALVLRKTAPHERCISHVLTSGARTFREERTRSERDWWFLAPAIVDHTTYDVPHIHIGRSQGIYSSYNSQLGLGRSPWDARASIIGQGVQVTFAPTFYTPDWMLHGAEDAPGHAVQYIGAPPFAEQVRNSGVLGPDNAGMQHPVASRAQVGGGGGAGVGTDTHPLAGSDAARMRHPIARTMADAAPADTGASVQPMDTAETSAGPAPTTTGPREPVATEPATVGSTGAEAAPSTKKARKGGARAPPGVNPQSSLLRQLGIGGDGGSTGER